MFGLGEAHVRPVLAAVGGLVDAIADRDAVAHPRLAGADPDDLRILRVDRDGADGLYWLLVENGFVRSAAIGRFPDTAARRADVER